MPNAAYTETIFGIAIVCTVQAAAGQDAGRQELLRVQQEIGRLQQRETQTLTGMVGVMTPDQIRRVASSLRVEREAMQRDANEIQARLEKQSLTAEADFTQVFL